ncbi:hypothetical protein CR513_11835, partial [Mucuna pruriens]
MRSIREKRQVIPDDYIDFLQEYEDGIGFTEDDPINFCQVMQSSNSQKWINAMKDELKLCKTITFGISSNYLKRTKGYMLTYQKSEGLEIIKYFDLDFVGCQDNKCSISGYIYMLARGAISWKSVKQTLIAPSTIVVEFVACFEASNQSSK